MDLTGVESPCLDAVPVAPKFEKPSSPHAVMPPHDEVSLIHENTISASSSYVNESPSTLKSIKKLKTKNSTTERPQTTREKAKKAVEAKPDVKYSHKLGELPSYLKKRKQQSAANSLCSSKIEIDDSRPKTVDLSMTELQKAASKIQFLPQVPKEVQGDVKSIKSQVSISARPRVHLESRSKIALLTKSNEMMKLECEKLKSDLNGANEQQKSKADRVKSLELKIARLQKELKQNADVLEKLMNTENELSNQKKNVDSLNGRLKIKEDAMSSLKLEMKKLINDLNMQKSSNETLTMEKHHLQRVLDDLQKEQKFETKDLSPLTTEIVALNEKLATKIEEISALKDIISSLNEEIDSLKTVSQSSSRASVNSEMMRLQDKILSLKKNEEKLTLETHKLNSLLDDAKNEIIHNETLLGLRSDYIKTLQETDDINKIRLATQGQELLGYRKQAKEFEKFKAAHEEEKQNFEGMLNDLREKIIKIETERDMYKKWSTRKSRSMSNDYNH